MPSGDVQGRPIQLSYSSEGLHLNISLTIPPVRELARIAKLRVLSLRNHIRNRCVFVMGARARIARLVPTEAHVDFFVKPLPFPCPLPPSVFPLAPLGVLGLLVFGTALVLYSPADAWVRSGWLADLVWNLSLKVSRCPFAVLCLLLTCVYVCACAHLLQLPAIEEVPQKARIGILAALTTFGIALLLATIQRCLLRCLLRYKGFLYNARKPTKLDMVWGLAMKLLIGNRQHRLYSFQGVLPSLPVPSLKDTCERYLASVAPLQDPQQFAKTKVRGCGRVRVCPLLIFPLLLPTRNWLRTSRRMRAASCSVTSISSHGMRPTM